MALYESLLDYYFLRTDDVLILHLHYVRAGEEAGCGVLGILHEANELSVWSVDPSLLYVVEAESAVVDDGFRHGAIVDIHDTACSVESVGLVSYTLVVIVGGKGTRRVVASDFNIEVDGESFGV